MNRLDHLPLCTLLTLAMACQGATDEASDDETDGDTTPAENHAPGKPRVTIDPGDPIVGTALTAVATSQDPDGDELTYTVRWTVDDPDVTFDAKAMTIPGDVVVRGQTWTATVAAHDAALASKVTKASVTVLDAPPEVATFTWGPADPRKGDTLTAVGTGTDPDGDRVNVSYRWTVDGGVVQGDGGTLAPGDFEKGSTVVVTLVLDDNHGGTTEQDSDPIVVANTPPTQPSVHVSPRIAHARDTVSCEVTAGGTDLDGDPLTYEVTWLRDGIPASTPATVVLDQVVTAQANSGSVWTCTAQSDDGTDQSVPAYASVAIGAEPPDVAEMALGLSFTCAARADGHTACWGLDGAMDPTTHVVAVTTGRTDPPDVDFTALVASDTWGCGVRASDAGIECWGAAQGADNPPDGIFANLDAAGDYACAQEVTGALVCWKRGVANLAEALVPPEGAWRTFGVGQAHGCAIDVEGAITCWGSPGSPTLDAPDGTFLTLSANNGHTCALAEDRTLSCWGANDANQATAPGGTFRAVAAGWQHTCGIHQDGTLECWGDASYGQTASPDGTFDDVWSGYRHSCARDTEGAIVCWGESDGGLLEIPWGKVASINVGLATACTVDDDGVARCFGSTIPSGATGAPWGEFAEVDVNATHACGRTEAGELLCWGTGAYGETTVPAGGGWDDVSTGLDFTCGLRSGSQQAECWGNPHPVVPVPFLGITGPLTNAPTTRAAQITTGTNLDGAFACELLLDGTVDCWGSVGTRTPETFTTIASGASSSCGIMAADKHLRCWGAFPYTVPPLLRDETWAEVTLGDYLACGLTEAGPMKCWGAAISVGKPVPKPTETGMTHLSTGGQTLCALDDKSRAWCWGAWGRQPLDAGL